MKKSMIWLTLILALTVTTAGYLVFEDHALQTTRKTITFSRLPDGFSGYRIAQISDLHNTHSAALRTSLRKSLHREAPDLIVLTGDLIDRRRTDADAALEIVQDNADVAPMYYVSGNHESLSDAYPDFRTKLEALGVHVLDDRYVTLRKGEDAVCLAGVDDPVMAKEWIDDDLAMEKHIAAMDLPSDLFTILLSHRPELLQVYAQYGIDLVFSGHAHGGQIRLPFIGGLFAPCQGLLPRYTSGIYTIEYTQMVVSRGIGNSVFPFRVHNRPELVFITLSKS